MMEASKGPPEVADYAMGNISEARLDPSAAATEPCPYYSNRERCLLRPTTRIFLSSTSPPLLPPLIPSQVIWSRPRPHATLSMRPLSRPPYPCLRSTFRAPISPSCRAPLESPSFEEFLPPQPAVHPPIVLLLGCPCPYPPLFLVFLVYLQVLRCLELSNFRWTTPEPQEETVIVFLARRLVLLTIVLNFMTVRSLSDESDQ